MTKRYFNYDDQSYLWDDDGVVYKLYGNEKDAIKWEGYGSKVVWNGQTITEEEALGLARENKYYREEYLTYKPATD